MSDLSGRHAWVTGGGSGIGLASAVALAAAGAQVHLVGRNRERLEEAAAQVAGAAQVHAVDVTDTAAVAELFADAQVDILVDSAGRNIPKVLDEVTEADFDAVFDVNVRASFFVVQHAVRAMRRTGTKGSIILISSQMGHVGGPKRIVYCGSKWALEGMTRALALELAPEGIRVNTVAPTFVDTELTQSSFAEPGFREFVLSSIPMGVMAQPQDVAAAVEFLAGDGSRMITGTSIMVDGGWTAQ